MFFSVINDIGPLAVFALAFVLVFGVCLTAISPLPGIIGSRQFAGRSFNLRLNALSRALTAWNRFRWLLSAGGVAAVLGLFAMLGLTQLSSVVSDLRSVQSQLRSAQTQMTNLRDDHEREMRETEDQHRREIDSLERRSDDQTREDIRTLRDDHQREVDALEEEIADLETAFEEQMEENEDALAQCSFELSRLERVCARR